MFGHPKDEPRVTAKERKPQELSLEIRANSFAAIVLLRASVLDFA
jgi:Zn-dependent peptidase ImmA (M78 family)